MIPISTNRLKIQTAMVVFGDAINFSATILSAMLLARAISVRDMGTYRQVLFLTEFILLWFEMGLRQSIFYFSRTLEPHYWNRYLKWLFFSYFALGASASLLLLILSYPLSVLYTNPSLFTSMIAFCMFPIVQLPLNMVRPVLICKGGALSATLWELFFSSTYVLSLYIPIKLGMPLSTSLFICSFVCLIRICLVPILIKELTWPWMIVWDKTVSPQVLRYVWPLQLSKVPYILSQYMDKFITSYFFNIRTFAAYSLGARELPFVGNVGTSVSDVLLPSLVQDLREGRVDEALRRWRSAASTVALFTYPVAAFAIWHGVVIMRIMFTDKYPESVIPFRILAVLVFVRVIAYSNLAKAMNRNDLIVSSTVVQFVAGVVLIISLTIPLGISGPPLAFVCSMAIGLGYLLVKYSSALKKPIFAFLPVGRLLLITAVAFVSAAASGYVINEIIGFDFKSGTLMFVDMTYLLSAFSLFAVIYIVLSILTGLIPITYIKSNISALLEKAYASYK